jgi:hypothetical protein
MNLAERFDPEQWFGIVEDFFPSRPPASTGSKVW